MLIQLVSALALAATPVPVAPSPQQAPSDAYLDGGAAELLRKARERRTMIDRSVTGYTAVVQEHISAGLRTLARERMIFGRDVAGRVEWNRGGPVRIEVLGAREVLPPVLKNAQLPDDLRDFMPHLAFDPVDAETLIRLDTTFVRHPIAPDGERWYRYRTGDTMAIRLPGGREVRLAELVVTPREDDVHLISGSFWLDTDTHSVVRAVFRPARAWELADFEEDDDDVPGFIKPIRAELLYISIEYGLWELRWWMPRLVAAEGVFQISFMTMPLKYERSYSGYTVRGDTTVVAVADTLKPEERCRTEFRMRVSARIGDEDVASRGQPYPASDTAAARRRAVRAARQEARDSARAQAERAGALTGAERERRCIQEVDVTVPEDEASLLRSEWLPPDPYTTGAALMTPIELKNLEAQLRDIPEAPWQLHRPSFDWGLGAAGLVRYNRVEALSIGARSDWDLGRMRIGLGARLGVADLEPNAELSIVRESPARALTLAGYRRLTAANPENRPLAVGNSINALLFGRDDGEYFRAAGAELLLRPPVSRRQWFELRVFAEHQSRANVGTDFSVPHLLDSDRAFRPNITARRADQLGAALTLRAQHGLDPAGFRAGADLNLEGEGGTFRFARAALILRAAAPLPAAAMIALESAAGTSGGTVPVQSHWFLGGPATLRGYDAAVAAGDAFWRGRLELSRGIPAARFAVYTDLGWAGPRNLLESGRPLQAFGAGAAFLDGLVRFDVARGVRHPVGWRVDLWVGGAF
jgi:hypothetical protein